MAESIRQGLNANATVNAYQAMLKANAAEAQQVKETTFTVCCKNPIFRISCNNCFWEQVITTRSAYEELKAGNRRCKSCGARFAGIKKAGDHNER